MNSLPRILIALLLLGPALQGVALAQQEESVVVTRIEGQLAEAMIATLDRAIQRAESEGAAALIIEIDTPGGEVTLMDRIGRKIEMCKVQPVAYVLNEAVSAGAFIAMACEQIYTYERAQIGSSTPIQIAPFGIVVPETEEKDNLSEKQISYVRSKFRDRAQAHDRPGMDALAEAMVDREVEVLLVQHGRDERPMTRLEFEDLLQREGRGAASIVRTICERGTLLNLTAQEAFDLGFSDGIVLSRSELLQALGLKDARVIEIWPSWSEKLVGLLEGVQWLLLIAGLVLIYIEIKAPGFGLPGALGILCLALLMFKNYLVGLAEVPEILLVVLGLVLIGLEIFVIPGFGAAGIAGITCVALGVIFSFLPFLVPEGPLEVDLLAVTLRNFVISLGVTLIGSYALSKYLLPKTPILRRMILDTGAAPATLGGSASSLPLAGGAAGRQVKAGDLGSAVSYLRPAGKVEVGDDHLDAMSEGDFIERGEQIVVVRVESNHVVVRRAASRPASEGEA